MCLDSLKKNRNWALWLSGLFGAVSLGSLALAILNQPLTILGIALDRNIYLIRFVITAAISCLLLHYWGKAQRKRR